MEVHQHARSFAVTTEKIEIRLFILYSLQFLGIINFLYKNLRKAGRCVQPLNRHLNTIENYRA